jgi:hypothetical protein
MLGIKKTKRKEPKLLRFNYPKARMLSILIDNKLVLFGKYKQCALRSAYFLCNFPKFGKGLAQSLGQSYFAVDANQREGTWSFHNKYIFVRIMGIKKEKQLRRVVLLNEEGYAFFISRS